MTVEEALNSMNSSDGFSIVIRKDEKDYTIDISEAVTRSFDSGRVEDCQSQISFFDYLFHRDVVLSLKPDSVQVNQGNLQKILDRKSTRLNSSHWS